MAPRPSIPVMILALSSTLGLAAGVTEVEPNNEPAKAQPIQVGDTFTFTLPEKGDFDYVKVKSPGDGVIRVIQSQKSKAHGWVYVWWMLDEKRSHRGGRWDVAAKKDELVVFGIRSSEHSWRYVASDEKVEITVKFEKAAFPEPDNTPRQAVPVALGKPFSIQLNPQLDHDYRSFTSPGDGYVVLSQKAKSPTHGWVHPWWMVGPDQYTRAGEFSQNVTKNQKVIFGMRSSEYSWHELGNNEVIDLELTYHPEISAHEPNNNYATAEPIELNKEVKLLMAPRRDQDYFTFTAPADGVAKIVQLNKPKEIGNLYPWWMINQTQYVRPGEFDQLVKKGEKVVFAVRSSEYSWHEKLSNEIIRIKVTFDRHFDGLPANDSFGSARPVKLGTPFVSQLNPRRDKDFFKVTAPGAGTLKLRQITKSKTHANLYPVWMKSAQTYFRAGQWDRSVVAGETVVFYVRSSQYHWHEVASTEQVKLLLTYTPEDPGAEPNNSMRDARPVQLGKPFSFQLNPRGDRDYFSTSSTSSGILKLTRLDKKQAHRGLRWWWGEDDDRYEQSPQIAEKRVSANQKAIFAFRSHEHSWNEVGSDYQLQFKIDFLPETDANEPNDAAADSTPIEVGKPFSYVMQPADDTDCFTLKATEDKVLLARTSEGKQLPHPAHWLEVGTDTWTKQPWVTATEGKTYILKVVGNRSGISDTTPVKTVVLSGTAKEFNLVKPIPHKRWSFEIKEAK